MGLEVVGGILRLWEGELWLVCKTNTKINKSNIFTYSFQFNSINTHILKCYFYCSHIGVDYDDGEKPNCCIPYFKIKSNCQCCLLDIFRIII